MEHSDDVVEKVLAGLRSVMPPEELEGRVLGAIQARAAARQRSWRPAWLRPAIVFPLGCALAAALLLIVVAPWHRTGLPGSVLSPANETAAVLPATTQQPQTVPHSVRTKLPSRIAPSGRMHAVDVPLPPEAIEAASYPAPAMPLTEEEKLLLRVSHVRDPQSVAILNPQVQAKRNEVEVAQFEDFFKEQKIEVKNETIEQQ